MAGRTRDNYGDKPMKRRKFVIGLGALAAGSAVTMNTGAISQGSAQRALHADLKGDGNAYLQIGKGAGDHGIHVNNGNEQMSLEFSDGVGLPQKGNGVNYDALTYFDRVFKIQNRGAEDIEVDINCPLSRVSFYAGEPGSSPTFPVRLDDEDPGPNGGDNLGGKVAVGVRIDTRGLTQENQADTELFGSGDNENDFTIIANQVSQDGV